MAPEARRASEGTAVDLSMNAVTVEEILTGFIATETRRTGLERVVVGLSGGLDSATCAAIPSMRLRRGSPWSGIGFSALLDMARVQQDRGSHRRHPAWHDDKPGG